MKGNGRNTHVWKGGTVNTQSSSVIIIYEMQYTLNGKGSGIWFLDITSAIASCSYQNLISLRGAESA